MVQLINSELVYTLLVYSLLACKFDNSCDAYISTARAVYIVLSKALVTIVLAEIKLLTDNIFNNTECKHRIPR